MYSRFFILADFLLFEHSLFCCLWLVYFWSLTSSHGPEAEFLDEIQTKVLRVFLLVIHSHLYSFSWYFHFFKPTQPLTVFLKEKGGRPDRKPYPLPYGLRNPYRNLKIMPRIPSTWLYVHIINSASGLWRRRLCVCLRSMACPTLLTWSSPPATTSTRRPSFLSTSRCESTAISRQFLQLKEDEQEINNIGSSFSFNEQQADRDIC